SARDVRSFGVAGLLHDIGKVKIPIEVLTKPGRFSDSERALMNRHPAEGARLILRAEEDLDLAAVVAYEHHIMLNGDGYPTFQFRRDCHEGSKLVHVCDVYDALRTNRPIPAQARAPASKENGRPRPKTRFATSSCGATAPRNSAIRWLAGAWWTIACG